MGDIFRFWHLPSNGVVAKIAIRDLDLLFGGQIFTIFYIFETVRSSAKCVGDICRFYHLPFKGLFSNIAISDIDLLFGGQILNLFISLKR